MNQNTVTFLRTSDEFGGLSNMSTSFPIRLNNILFQSSEHLYQTLKFTESPDIQTRILTHNSPIRAKMEAKKKEYRSHERPDWMDIRVEVMEFCLKAKLLWHWVAFGNLLRNTGTRSIVEISSKRDTFWGMAENKGTLDGQNTLGKLLTNLRDQLLEESNNHLRRLTPPDHLSLKLGGRPIEVVDRTKFLTPHGTKMSGHTEYMKG